MSGLLVGVRWHVPEQHQGSSLTTTTATSTTTSRRSNITSSHGTPAPSTWQVDLVQHRY